MEEFFIENKGSKLHAKLECPPGSKQLPLVIVVHGLIGDMEEAQIAGVSDAINEAGFATLRVDMYGHGKSDGDLISHTIPIWLNDLEIIRNYARSIGFQEFILCGHSQGGLCAIVDGGMNPDKYAALIELAPAVSIVEGARNGKLLDMEFDPDHIPEKLTDGSFIIGREYIQSAQKLDPFKAMQNYPKPVLIIHGNQDVIVPYTDSLQAGKIYTDAEVVIISGEDHDFNNHPEEMKQAVKNFLIRFKEGYNNNNR